MAIITTAEVKSFLGITSTTYDTRIDSLIEPVLFDVFDYTNNYFHNNAVRIRGQIFTFSTTGTIVVDGTNFSTYSFASGDEIHVVDSVRNDGLFTASSVSSATITVSTENTVLSETEESNVTIVKMDVPKSLKPIIASMIWFRIDKPYGTVVSESLGDYSVTYAQYGSAGGEYPNSINRSLNKYRCVKYA